MTLEELAAAAADIDRLFAERVHVWRVVIGANGEELRRIYRGSFQQPPDSHIGEAPADGYKTGRER